MEEINCMDSDEPLVVRKLIMSIHFISIREHHFRHFAEGKLVEMGLLAALCPIDVMWSKVAKKGSLSFHNENYRKVHCIFIIGVDVPGWPNGFLPKPANLRAGPIGHRLSLSVTSYVYLIGFGTGFRNTASSGWNRLMKASSV